jgi:hypothetical protein
MRKLNKKYYFILTLIITSFIIATGCLTDFRIKGHYFGIFLLKGEHGKPIEVHDDLLLGEESKLLGGVPLMFLHNLLMPSSAHASLPEPQLILDWDDALGEGWVRSVQADQTEMHFYFSRFISDQGIEKHGLFVGGNLPPAAMDLHDPLKSSDSGISFFDGHRNWHIWCNANEVIAPRDAPGAGVQTADWRYLGSWVEKAGGDRVVLGSRHELMLAGVQLHIDRRASFRAGAPTFDLGIHITNAGTRPVSYIYAYADEPWLGDYGSSEGVVGWLKEGLVSNEGLIDTAKHQHAGMINLKYGLANVVAWPPDAPPSLACFSNAIGRLSPGVPLNTNDRALNLQWERTLQPGETHKIEMTIGMARIDLATGIPRL